MTVSQLSTGSKDSFEGRGGAIFSNGKIAKKVKMFRLILIFQKCLQRVPLMQLLKALAAPAGTVHVIVT